MWKCLTDFSIVIIYHVVIMRDIADGSKRTRLQLSEYQNILIRAL